ncbi:MAG TPA: response regulator transcription factor [Anaerolineales bacterium]|nr:response regulator transcription factor [Anaerolineales bacterium]
MPNFHILVVDDDPLVCKGLKFNLEQAGYKVSTASTAHIALELSQRNPFDAAILDIGLPDDNGLDLCKKLKKQHDLPVIFLTARRRELDEIVGLEIGADDYITKPFSADIVLAHLRAILRRVSRPITEPRALEGALSAGLFILNPVSHVAQKDGHDLDLAPREFELLHMFMSYPERAFTSEELVEGVWGVEFVGEPQVLYVQVRSLRMKIEENPSAPKHILTLRGVGYKFVP